MADENVKVNVGADAAGLTGTLNISAEQVESFATKLISSFEAIANGSTMSMAQMTSSIVGGCESSTAAVAGLEAVAAPAIAVFAALAVAVAGIAIAGHELIKLAKNTAEFGHEVELTAAKTGMTTDKVQELGFAATACGVKTETLNMALKKLHISMYKVESSKVASALNSIGLKANDLKNIPLYQQFLKISDALSQYNDSGNKAAVVNILMGKTGSELMLMLDAGSVSIESYMKKAKDLGLVMSEEDIKAAAGFKVELNLLEAGFEGLKRKIGSALIPAFDKLLSSLLKNEEKTHAIANLFKDVLVPAAIAVAIAIAWLAKEIVTLTINLRDWKNSIIGCLGPLGALYAYLHRDENAKKQIEEVKAAYEEFKKTLQDALAASKELNGEILKTTKAPKKEVASQEGKAGKGDKEEEKNALALAEAKEAIEKAQLSQEEKDIEFAVEHGNMTREKGLEEHKKIINNEAKAQADAVSSELKAKESLVNKEKISAAEKSKIITGLEEIASQKRVLIETEAQNKIIALERKTAEAMKKDKAAELKDAESEVKQEVELQKVKNERLEAEGKISTTQMKSLNRELNLYLQNQADTTFEKLKALYKNDVKEFKKICEEKKKADADFELQRQKNALKEEKEEEKIWAKLAKSMSKSFSSSLSSMIKGEKSFVQSMKSLWGNMLDFFISTICEGLMTEWVKTGSLKMAWAKITDMFVTDSAVQSSAITKAASVADSSAKIAAETPVMAVKAGSSVANIPYIGWILMAVAFAAGMALGNSAKSAAGGYDIPAGVNPMTQLHAEEMVLPKNLANPLRKQLAGGGSQGGSTVVNITAMDSKSFSKFIAGNHGAFRGAARNFAYVR